MTRSRISALVVFGALLGLWQILPVLTRTTLLFSTPADVALLLARDWSRLGEDFLITFTEAAAGFGAACFFGLLATLLALRFPGTLGLTLAGLSVVQVVPMIVFAPLFISLLGYGFLSKAAMAFLFVIVTFLIGVLSSFPSIPRSYHELAQVSNVDRMTAIRTIFLPLMAPDIFATTKICAGLAVLGAVVAEFAGASAGLGKNIFLSTVRLEPELMWASVVLTAAAGLLLVAVVAVVERPLGHWYLHRARTP